VKLLESLLQLERNAETKFFGCQAQFCLENCNWKQLHGMIVSSDHVGNLSKIRHVKNMDNFFSLGTVWSKKSLKVLTKKEKVQMEKAVLAFCIKKFVQNSFMDLKMLNETFG